jgi:predicted nucleotidyltransferase
VTVAEAQVETFVAEVVAAVEAAGPRAVGAFVLGSALLGGFDPERSDLDVTVVVQRPLDEATREAMVSALDELPVPFRKLELVIYARGARPPAYELNYPDGPGERDFWFVLDAAIGQERAGSSWLQLLQPVTAEETRRAAEEMLRWAEERGHELARPHALRARHYLETGTWTTKKEAVQ